MNILFTCAGRRTYLLKYFREQLKGDGLIVATDMQLSAPALTAADVKKQVPSVYDPQYIDITLDICKQYDIKGVLCLNDLELPILAANKERFEEIGVTVIVSSPEVIDICFDKYKTAQFVASLGINAPQTYARLEDAVNAIQLGSLNFPVVLKPRWGSGSIGIEYVDNLEDLKAIYEQLLSKVKKTILATASVGNEYIMIQEKLCGQEYGLDVMNDLNGRNVAVAVKRKLAMRAGETDKAVTEDNSVVYSIGRKIGENLHHIGNLDVDVMQRADGKYCVLELNPRFGGGYPFSYEAGVNMPKAIIEWLKGNDVDPSILQQRHGEMYAKNDYLVRVN